MSSRLQREVDAIFRKEQRRIEEERLKNQKDIAVLERRGGYIASFWLVWWLCGYLVGLFIEEADTFPVRSFQSFIHTYQLDIPSPLFHFAFACGTIVLSFHLLTLTWRLWSHGEVTWTTRLADLPLWSVLILFSIGMYVYLAIVFTGSLLGFALHSMLMLAVGYAHFFESSVEKHILKLDQEFKSADQKRDEEIQFVLDGATEEDIEALKQVKRCEICKRESLYDLCLECDKKWQAERHRVRNQILRAKQHNVPATLTLVEWLAILDRFHWRCAYCQTGPFEVMEHYVPISQGGGTTAENVAPSCIPCNAKKSGNHPDQPHHTYRPFQESGSEIKFPVKRTTPITKKGK